MEQIRTNIKNGLKLYNDEAIRRNIEIWKAVDYYDNYEVSSFGKVRNITSGRILKPGKYSNGYHYVALSNAGKKKNHNVHRLVANAFIQNLNQKKCVDHIDNNIINNKVSNLRFATNQQNRFNSSTSKNNTSGCKGVSFHKSTNKWRARIKINNKSIHIGYFVSLEEAKAARQNKAKELFGEYINSCEL